MDIPWVGPFAVEELLRRSLDYDSMPWPPEAGGVYLLSRKPWCGEPTRECEPLYVGGNTGTSRRSCTHVGDLIADLYGFFGDATGYHSGGKKLHRYCREHCVDPGTLHLAWLVDVPCPACAERQP